MVGGGGGGEAAQARISSHMGGGAGGGGGQAAQASGSYPHPILSEEREIILSHRIIQITYSMGNCFKKDLSNTLNFNFVFKIFMSLGANFLGHRILAPITETCLCNFDPLKPHFYIVKLGFTGVYIIFLNFALKHTLWVLVRTASPRLF